MAQIEIDLDFSKLPKGSRDSEIIKEVLGCRKTAAELIKEERNIDAMERIVEGLRIMREFSDYENKEFRTLLVALLFDLSELHYALKDYKQSEKELEVLFRVLERLIKEDSERFGHYHILAMELSTRILRSRKKTMDLLAKQKINAGNLYDKVNSGVSAATDKLVDSLRNVGELLASAGEYKAALKFYSEAITLSKKRAGRVTRKEIKMTIEMAKIMMRIHSMRPRAKRLLNAILHHAISLEQIEQEEDILALLQIIESDFEQEQGWKAFLYKIQKGARNLQKETQEKVESTLKRVKGKIDSSRKEDTSKKEGKETSKKEGKETGKTKKEVEKRGKNKEKK